MRNCLQKVYNIIVNHLFQECYELCERLLLEVPKHREFLGFTGNTQTSYACGLYVDGRLEGIIAQQNWNAPPLRKKVPMNKWAYLRNPYEGRSRSVRGKVQVDKEFGQSTSYKFLKSYSARKGRIQIVMTTGTEYSEYLELVLNLDVLSGTFESAKTILAQGFKPLPPM